MKRQMKRWFLTASAAMTIAGASSCTRSEAPVQAKTSGPDAATPFVAAARVQRGNVSSRAALTAEFQPFQEVDVMAKVAGYVRSIRVDLGDQVREGQVLAELQIPEMTDDLARAAAVIEQNGAEISAARDELQRAESTHQIVHLSSERVQNVAKREPGLIPQQEVDEARSRDLVAEAQVAAAKSKLRVEEQKTRVSKADETRLLTLRNYVTITAPFSGKVTKRYANVGSMIQAGISSQSQAMPLVRLSQISTLRLSLPVPESLVPTVRVGQQVDVQVKSLGRTFAGRVARSSGRVDAATRTMVTEVDVPNPSGVIMPGMYAEVALEVKEHSNVLTVPLDAIERSGSSSRVYRVEPSGTVRIVPVQLGLEDAQRAEVLSGLQDADVVITGRRAGINAGDQVKPKVESAQ